MMYLPYFANRAGPDVVATRMATADRATSRNAITQHRSPARIPPEGSPAKSRRRIGGFPVTLTPAAGLVRCRSRFAAFLKIRDGTVRCPSRVQGAAITDSDLTTDLGNLWTPRRPEEQATRNRGCGSARTHHVLFRWKTRMTPLLGELLPILVQWILGLLCALAAGTVLVRLSADRVLPSRSEE